MNYLLVFLVHDGKQKNVFAIHFANYIDHSTFKFPYNLHDFS